VAGQAIRARVKYVFPGPRQHEIPLGVLRAAHGRRQPGAINARRHSEPESEQPLRRRHDWPKGGTYRTLCVRLCDGFYFLISYSTLRWRFAS
jgi:hypothetical protein